MNPILDQVRDRTADLHRVAEGIRRERDLRASVADVPAPRPAILLPLAEASADPRSGDCLPSTGRQAA